MKFIVTAAVLLLCISIGTAQTPTPAAPAAATPAPAAPAAATPATPATATSGMPDVTHGPVLEYTSDHDAVIAWTSKSGAQMQVKYGTSPTSLTQTANAAENSRGTNHRVKLTSLQPSTTYYFQMTNSAGQPDGSVLQFQTVAKGAAPNKANQNLGPK